MKTLKISAKSNVYMKPGHCPKNFEATCGIAWRAI